MKIITVSEVEKKPIDILYDIIGGEDRRYAPEGLAEMYDEICEDKMRVDKFNHLVDIAFGNQATSVSNVENYVKTHKDELLEGIGLS